MANPMATVSEKNAIFEERKALLSIQVDEYAESQLLLKKLEELLFKYTQWDENQHQNEHNINKIKKSTNHKKISITLTKSNPRKWEIETIKNLVHAIDKMLQIIVRLREFGKYYERRSPEAKAIRIRIDELVNSYPKRTSIINNHVEDADSMKRRIEAFKALTILFCNDNLILQ